MGDGYIRATPEQIAEFRARRLATIRNPAAQRVAGAIEKALAAGHSEEEIQQAMRLRLLREKTAQMRARRLAKEKRALPQAGTGMDYAEPRGRDARYNAKYRDPEMVRDVNNRYLEFTQLYPGAQRGGEGGMPSEMDEKLWDQQGLSYEEKERRRALVKEFGHLSNLDARGAKEVAMRHREITADKRPRQLTDSELKTNRRTEFIGLYPGAAGPDAVGAVPSESDEELWKRKGLSYDEMERRRALVKEFAPDFAEPKEVDFSPFVANPGVQTDKDAMASSAPYYWRIDEVSPYSPSIDEMPPSSWKMR